MARHLLVTNDFPPKVGGIQSYLWELWSRLDPEQFVVLTASSHPQAPAFDAEQAARGVRIDRVRGPILYFPSARSRARVRTLAAEVDASLVLFDPALPLGLLGPTLGVPYGVVLHGAEVTVPARVPGCRAVLASVLRRSSLVVSAGGYPATEAARLLERGGVGARARSGLGERPAGWTPRSPGRLPRQVVVPPGVDCERFVPLSPAARQAARARLGLAVDAPLVASVSRLVPRKGMDVLVEAAARLAPSVPGLTVAIAGTGREADQLGAQVRRLGAPVRLLGRVSEEDKAQLLGAADVFAMACRDRWGGLEQEGFGIVFLEAAAVGVPQVAGDSGGAADAVVDGVTGLVVRRSDDAREVAAAIGRLLADEGLRRRMGDAARRRAVEEHDHGVLASVLATALAEVQG